MSPLLNYRTVVPAVRTIGTIQNTLAAHGALALIMEYGPQGRIVALAFKVDGPAGRPLSIQLPIDMEATRRVMEREGLQPRFLTDEHAYRVAWRIIKDWVEAQMALLETEMVKMEQIFLPYIITGSGRTVYEVMAGRHFELREGDR